MAFPSMGRNPRPSVPRPGSGQSREDFHLATARQGFVYDDRPIEEALPDFERAVEHVLAGGAVDPWGRPTDTPAPRDPTLATTQ